MNVLERYIAVSILKATAVIALIISGVLFLLTLLGQLKNLGQGDYGLLQALIVVLMRMPTLVYQFSPLLVLLGSIVGLSLLYTHREMIVMRTSGLSVLRILKSVLLTALILVLILGCLGEWLGPPLSFKAQVHKENLQSGGQAVVTNKGIWFHIDNNFMHVQRIVNKTLLKGVTTYQFDKEHYLQSSLFANTIRYENGIWLMEQVAKTTLYPDHTESAEFPKLKWDIQLNPNLFNVGLMDAEEMSLPKLAKFASYLKTNGLQAREYEYNFWQRVFEPLSSIIMIMLSVPFVLSALSSSTLGWRIIVGLIIGFTFFILDAFLGELCIVYQLPAFIAAAITPFLFALTSIFLTRRMLS